MKNKRYIYPWLILPLIACLLAGMAGCSDDVTDEGGASSDSSIVNLTISSRGINNNVDIDHYIKEFRIIAFSEDAGYFMNEKYTRDGSGAFSVPDENTSINTTDDRITVEKNPFSNISGKYVFYVIANESGYTVGTSQPQALETYLNQIKTKENFTKLIESNPAINYPNDATNFFILMTAEHQGMIYQSDKNQIGDILLERAIAKVNFKIVDKSFNNLTFSDVYLQGTNAKTFGLNTYIPFDPGDNSGTRALTLDGNNEVTFYLPERYLSSDTDPTKALQLILTATPATGGQSVTYSNQVYIGPDDKEGGYKGYSIFRNTEYNITATINQWEDPLMVDFEIQPWEWVEQQYEISENGTFVLGHTNVRIHTKDEKKAIATTYDAGESGSENSRAVFTLKMTSPQGVQWMGHLTNAAAFEFVDENGQPLPSLEGIGDEANEVTVRIRSNQEFDESTNAYAETAFYVTLATNPNEHQLIDVEGITQGGQTDILIRQVTKQEFENLSSNTN